MHERLYDDFVAGYVELAYRYVLGDPLDPATTLGPMVRPAPPTSCAGRSTRRCARVPVR